MARTSETELSPSSSGNRDYQAPITPVNSEDSNQLATTIEANSVEDSVRLNISSVLGMFKKRKFNRPNLVRHLASKIYRDRDSAILNNDVAYRVFLRGIPEGHDAGEINAFEDIVSTIQLGSIDNVEFEEMFSSYSISQDSANINSPDLIRDNIQVHLEKQIMKLSTQFELLGGHILLKLKSSHLVSNELNTVTSVSAENVLNIIESTPHYLDSLFNQEIYRSQLSSYRQRTSAAVTSNEYSKLNINRKKCFIQKQLLKIYRKTSGRPTILRIPWGTITVNGWPQGISYNFAALTVPQLDELKRLIDLKAISFRNRNAN